MMSKVRGTSGTSDQLLPGRGHTPSYGIHGDSERDINYSVVTNSTKTATSANVADSKGKERVLVVARCVLTVCLASLVAGMNGGFTSPALPELENPTLTSENQLFMNTTVLPNAFGVSLYDRVTFRMDWREELGSELA